MCVRVCGEGGGGAQANIPRPLILEAELLLDFADDPDFGEQLLEVVLRHLVTNTAYARGILRFASRWTHVPGRTIMWESIAAFGQASQSYLAFNTE